MSTESKHNSIEIIQPDDMHVHFRDGDVLKDVVPHTAAQFAKCLVMPNLKSPVVNSELAIAYYERIKQAVPNNLKDKFEPFLTLYLTDKTNSDEVKKALDTQIIKGFKLYPAGATTLSENGVTNIKNCYAVIEQMQKYNAVLLVHGEVTDHHVDIFDREAKFIDDVLIPLRKDFPELKISFEHITTKQAADYVLSENSQYLGASITPQHLLYNRNHMLAGGIKPHYYCLPILKRSLHQQALLKAAISGSDRFYVGTDSAPHAKYLKENSCGCAGCYSALHAVELYTTAFEAENALDKLEGFMSIYGSKFYELPINTHKIKLIKQNWQVPNVLNFGNQELVPLAAGETMTWKLENSFL